MMKFLLVLAFAVYNPSWKKDEHIKINVSPKRSTVTFEFNPKYIASVEYWDTEFRGNDWVCFKLMFKSKVAKQEKERVFSSIRGKLETTGGFFVESTSQPVSQGQINVVLKKNFKLTKAKRPEPAKHYYHTAFFTMDLWRGRRKRPQKNVTKDYTIIFKNDVTSDSILENIFSEKIFEREPKRVGKNRYSAALKSKGDRGVNSLEIEEVLVDPFWRFCTIDFARNEIHIDISNKTVSVVLANDDMQSVDSLRFVDNCTGEYVKDVKLRYMDSSAMLFKAMASIDGGQDNEYFVVVNGEFFRLDTNELNSSNFVVILHPVSIELDFGSNRRAMKKAESALVPDSFSKKGSVIKIGLRSLDALTKMDFMDTSNNRLYFKKHNNYFFRFEFIESKELISYNLSFDPPDDTGIVLHDPTVSSIKAPKGYFDYDLSRLFKKGYYDLYNKKVEDSSIVLERKLITVKCNGVEISDLPQPLENYTSKLGPEAFKILNEKEPGFQNLLKKYLIRDWNLTHEANELILDIVADEIIFELNPNNVTENSKKAFAKSFSRVLGLKLSTPSRDGRRYTWSGPIDKPRPSQFKAPGFSIKKVSPTKYYVTPNSDPIKVRVQFFDFPFKGERRVVNKPRDLVLKDGQDSLLLKPSRNKVYILSPELREGDSIGFKNSLEGLTAESKKNELVNRGVDSDSGDFLVKFDVRDKESRVLIIYYPLQAETSYRSNVPSGIEADAAFRLLDNQLANLVRKLIDEDWYESIYIRFANSDRMFVEVSNSDSYKTILFENSESYGDDVFAWDNDDYSRDHEAYIKNTTTFVDVLYLDAIGTAGRIKQHFGRYLDNVRFCLINFVNPVQKKGIGKQKEFSAQFYYYPVLFSELTGKKNILTIDYLQDFFNFSKGK